MRSSSALLVFSLVLTSCAQSGTNGQSLRFGTFTTPSGETREQVMMNPSDTIETCIASTTDAAAWCVDSDDDDLTPADTSTLWASDGSMCHCTNDGLPLPGFIAIDSTATLLASFDCSDSDASVGGTVTYYADSDSDTFGDATSTTDSCAMPSGYVADNTDCNDADAAINSLATDIPDNGIDEDCSGADAVTDADGDGYGIDVDCNDADASINPGAAEVVLNGIDDDCNAATPAIGDTATVTLCVTPVDGLIATSWQLWLRDGTVDSDGSATATWALPGAVQGVGQLCADTLVTNGNTEYINGPFDIDGDGTYGEFDFDGDGGWLYMNVVNEASATANGYSITVSRVEYDATTGASDGHWDVDLE